MGIFESYMVYFILGAFGLLQGIGIAMISRESKRRKNDNDARAKEITLSMQLQSANTALGVATAYALKEGKVNGKMEDALVRASEAELAYFKHINKLAANQIAE